MKHEISIPSYAKKHGYGRGVTEASKVDHDKHAKEIIYLSCIHDKRKIFETTELLAFHEEDV